MRAYIFILLILCLTGCGIFKKVHKESSLDKSSGELTVKSESTGATIDKTITTVKESADTSVIIPAKTITQETYFNMDSLVNGMTAVKNELIDVRFTLNPVTHALTTVATLKPQTVPFRFDRQTTIQNDIAAQIKHVQEVNEESKQEHKTNLVDKKPFNTFWVVVIVLGIVVIIVFALYKRSKL